MQVLFLEGHNRGAGRSQRRDSRRRSRRERLRSLVFTERSGVKIQCSDLLDEAATWQKKGSSLPLTLVPLFKSQRQT